MAETVIDKEVLESIGLTNVEAKVYLDLLELGSSTAGPLIKRLGLHRGTTYSVLERLIEKGLVTYIIKAGKRYFTAADPEVFLDMLKEREEKVKQILPKLKSKKERAQIKQIATIYEGNKAVKSFYEEMLRLSKPGDEQLVFGTQKLTEYFKNYFKNYERRRIKKGLKLKIAYSEAEKDLIKFKKDLPLTEVKTIPKELTTPAEIDICGITTAIVLWAKNPLAFVMQNKDVADSFRSYFNLLWQQEVKIYRGFDDVMGKFASMIDFLKEGEEYYVLGATLGEWRNRLRKWFGDYHRERIKRKIRLKILYIPKIRDEITYEMTHTGDPKMHLTEIKELPSAFSSPMQINLYRGDRVLIFFFGKDMMCFEIESEVLYKNFKAYFDAIWSQETRIVKGLDAIQEIFEEMLKSGKVDLIGARGYFMDLRPKYIDGWEKRAIKRGLKLRNIVDIGTKGHRVTKLPFAQTKYTIPKEFSKLSVFWIYRNKVVISNWTQKEPIAIIIENKALYEVYKQQFELLWNQKINAYEGQEAVEEAYNSIFESIKPEDEIVIFAAKPSTKRGTDFNLQIDKRLRSLVRRIRLIYYGVNEKNIKRAQEFEKINCETKIIPTKEALPISTVVAGNVILNQIWGKTPLTFKIENKTVAESLRSNFNLLWEEETRTYRGLEEIKNVFNETVSSLKPGDTWYAFVIGKNPEELHNFFLDLSKRRVKKGIKRKLIFSEDAETQCKIEAKVPLTSYRLISKKFVSPAVINMCGNIVLINFWLTEKERTVYKIVDKKIASLYKKQFDVLWKIAKK